MKQGLKISAILWLWPFLFLYLFSCAPARYIPQDEYLLNKNKVEVEGKSINKSEISNYLLQRPNKKWILGMRLNLFFYNVSNVIFKKWFKRIGEAPVIYDPFLKEKSYDQLKKYLETKGYYYSEIHDTVKFRKQNTKRRNVVVTYNIKPNEPFKVNNIIYFFEDTSLVNLIFNDTVNSLLHKGMLFDKEILQDERIRIEDFLKDNGYYKFSKEYIYFDAVATDSFNIDLTMGFKEFVEDHEDENEKRIIYHPQYKINNITVYPDYNPFNINTEIKYDTIEYKDIYYLHSGKLKIRPSTVGNYTYLTPGEKYRTTNVDKTYQNLSSLSVYKFVNVQFSEPENISVDAEGFYPLDVKIELTRKKVQGYDIEPVVTNSASPNGESFIGDIGIRSNISYKNYNLFRGSEYFNLKLTGAIEILRDSLFSRTIEYGTEARIEFPRFWLPFKSEKFVKKFGPKTFIAISLNHRTDEKYVRTYANAAFGYTWKGNSYLRHSVHPIELNFVQVDDEKTKEFRESLESISYRYSFTDHFVGASRYTVEYNNQEIGKVKNFTYLKMNIESAGFLLNGINKLSKSTKYEDGYHILGESPFSQYLKNDYDLRFYRSYDARNTVVYRIFAGVGYPYGNSRSMPYEKRYFAGGAYGLRAWKAYTLGPGTYRDTSMVINPYAKYENIGDIKIELNFEYRFKLFWKVEGALFADAGNIWEINFDSNKIGSQFHWDKFYKEIALGVGFGARFDFSFFLIRFDVGMKIKDPSYPENERWLPFNHKYVLGDFPIQFGIGYPF